jgi:hypothetical protein
VQKMAAGSTVKHDLTTTTTEPRKTGVEVCQFHTALSLPTANIISNEQVSTILTLSSKQQSHVSITRLPNADDKPITFLPPSSAYHIYSKYPCHKLITPVPNPNKDRRSGPSPKQQKAARRDKAHRSASGLPPLEPDDNAFFLHKPYLAFHVPPHVLYLGNSQHATTPAVLIHQSCFWRKYKLQLGPSLAQPGVLDPRGVVAWKHHGGDKTALKEDGKKFKGYRVRTWRLWGETGKSYVHDIKKMRRHGKGIDPDNVPEAFEPARADEVVYLRWTSPFSRHTRRYHFHFRGVDFYWKGTGTTREEQRCGWFLRFNHLKLVARVPVSGDEKKSKQLGACLGKFTSSVAKQKSGVLELYDDMLLRLVEEHVPSMLEREYVEMWKEESPAVLNGSSEEKTSKLKKSTLYQVIMATAMCMTMSEKEKRHTLIDVILGIAEGGGGAGG